MGEGRVSTFSTSRGDALFVREMEVDNPKALVIFFHSLGEHTAAPGVVECWRMLNEVGYSVIGYDMAGHGRSIRSKEDRGLIKDWKHLVSDGITFVEAIYSDSRSFALKSKQKPYFLCGLSTGGMVCIHLAQEITKQNASWLPKPCWAGFLGALLLCPVIYQKVDPGILQTTALKGLKAIGFGKSDLGPKPDPNYFPSRAIYDQVVSDPFCYFGGMLLATGTSLLKMTEVTQGMLDDISYPFALFHATDDPVTPVSGSEKMLNRSKTPPEYKKLFQYSSLFASHYMLLDSNAPKVVSDMVIWMMSRLPKGASEAKDTAKK